MHLGGNNQKFDYFMESHKLETVSQEKDLGVWITDNLKPLMQCQYAYSEANRALGLIGRTISLKSKDVLIRLYKILVRPIWNTLYCVCLDTISVAAPGFIVWGARSLSPCLLFLLIYLPPFPFPSSVLSLPPSPLPLPFPPLQAVAWIVKTRRQTG